MRLVDWELVLKYLEVVLSWPVIALVIALVFRRSISTALKRLKKVSGFGQEAEFGDELAKVEATAEREAAELSPPSGRRGDQEGDLLPEADALRAEEEPSFVLLSAWEELRERVDGLASKLAENKPGSRHARSSIDQLAASHAVPGSDVDQYVRLRALRNQVAHGQHRPTPGEALAYAKTATMVWYSMLSAARHPAGAPLWRERPD